MERPLLKTTHFKGFRFCSHCGGLLGSLCHEEGVYKKCTQCGFQHFFNPVPCTGILLLDEQKRILLIERLQDPGRGKWDFPGGFQDFGEHPDQAIVREIEEELGAQAELLGFLGVFLDEYGSSAICTHNQYYWGRLRTPLGHLNQEIAAIHWVSPQELASLAETPLRLAFEHTQAVIRHWLARKQ